MTADPRPEVSRDDEYATWITAVRAEFERREGWDGWADMNVDAADGCWRDLFDEGMTPEEVVDEELCAGGE